MHTHELEYPLLLLKTTSFAIIKRPEWLNVVFEPLIKNGYYMNAELIDGANRLYRITQMKILGGAGIFWGYALFYPRRVKVDTIIEPVLGKQVCYETIKRRILSDFVEDSTWASRDDYDELKIKLEQSQSLRALIQVLANAV